MIKDDIEIILKTNNWRKRESANPNIIDYSKDEPKNRIVIYENEIKYITESVLRELMLETDVDKKHYIISNAKEIYEESQLKLFPTEKDEKKVTELLLKNKLKSIIDLIPPEKLTNIITLIQAELSDTKKVIEQLPDAESVKDYEYSLLKREEKILPSKVVEGISTEENTTTIHGSTKEQTEIIERLLIEIRNEEKIYKSAVVINETQVRSVEYLKDAKGGIPVIFITKERSDADELVFLLDSTLKKEIELIKIKRIDEITVEVIFKRTGFKADWIKKKPRRFHYLEADTGRMLVDEDDRPVFDYRKKKKKEK